ncbi:MAG TPA: hypothetical protein VFW87_05130 [Pirellulales bacterium]|nr:hypothetical protein [Pirellulales bacterium]
MHFGDELTQRIAARLEFAQHGIERCLVGRRHRADRIEGRENLGLLRLAPTADQHRDRSLRQLAPRMAIDEPAGPLVVERGASPTHFVDRFFDRAQLRICMPTPIARVLRELFRRPPLQPQRLFGRRRLLRLVLFLGHHTTSIKNSKLAKSAKYAVFRAAPGAWKEPLFHFDS